jgi:uncharacterized membrane protein YtjA (UPF0391 family)
MPLNAVARSLPTVRSPTAARAKVARAAARKRVFHMLRWAVIFLVVAIAAAVLGFGGIAGEAAWMAKILFFVFLVVALVSFVLGRRVA